MDEIVRNTDPKTQMMLQTLSTPFWIDKPKEIANIMSFRESVQRQECCERGQDFDKIHHERTYITFNREPIRIFNMEEIKRTQTNVTEIHAHHNNSSSQGQPSKHYNNLETCVLLYEGCKIYLNNQLNRHMGLYTNAIGTVKDVIWNTNHRNNHTHYLPELLLVEFPSYTGPPLFLNHPHIIPIVPKRKYWRF